MPLQVSQFFWLFPVIAASSWFITLSVLLIAWLAEGRPRYPGQSNPYVAFISDIGAFSLRPFFITGSVITAASFAATVLLVHWARYSPSFYALIDDKLWRKALSIVATVLGIFASSSLIALSRFDTAKYHDTHKTLLLCCFAGLSGSAIATTAVWWREGTSLGMQKRKAKEWDGLRRWVIASNVIILVDVVLLVVFVALMYAKNMMRIAGILEWVMTIIGCGYLFSFAGYLWIPRDLLTQRQADGDERQPLLRHSGTANS